MEGWADRRVSIVEGALPPPPRNGKKDVVRRNFNLSPVLLIKLVGIDIHCIHAKWKGEGEGQALVHGGRAGWGPCPPPPPPLFHLC